LLLLLPPWSHLRPTFFPHVDGPEIKEKTRRRRGIDENSTKQEK